MIQILVVGGKLQGIEVTYLAKKAGYHVTVADKRKHAPAFGIADRVEVIDILKEEERFTRLFQEADVVIPAMEKKAVLEKLSCFGERFHIPVIFDPKAYEISSSKKKSNELFEKLDLPMPGRYGENAFPVIIKPDGLSGSVGVKKAKSKEEAEEILKEMGENAVVQEFLEGRSFSLEVIGDGNQFYFPQITEVVIDKGYDCKRIIAPASLSKKQEKQFYHMAEKLAKALKIRGIFDIEVICHNGVLKILEIDARFPSQTPISVYQSSGINMIQLLVELTLKKSARAEKKKEEVCYYQQISVEPDRILVKGEHILTDCKELYVKEHFFGAKEGITDYKKGAKAFKAILIVTAKTEKEARKEFLNCIDNINESLGNRQLKLIEG
ncbi:MAG: 3-methylornithine--L-lysine ligase PylC [Lachnospiraceae bacterium]|nr:3-methylornithine--L-lysine ligase PylC [Lachnospiraceae bacterium]